MSFITVKVRAAKRTQPLQSRQHCCFPRTKDHHSITNTVSRTLNNLFVPSAHLVVDRVCQLRPHQPCPLVDKQLRPLPQPGLEPRHVLTACNVPHCACATIPASTSRKL